MDLTRLLQLGAEMIRDNDDPATTGLDTGAIAGALQNILGSSERDIGSLLSRAMQSGLGEVIGSWIGQGENLPIEPDQVTAIVEEERIAEFARSLGIGEESAKKAIADALPQIVDKATPPEGGMLDDLLSQIGGLEGAANMFSKMFGR